MFNKLQTIFPEEMCSKIMRSFWEVVEILNEYNNVLYSKELIVGSLDHIAVGKNLYECACFKELLNQRSEILVSNVELRPDGSLVLGQIYSPEKDPKHWCGSNNNRLDEFILAVEGCLVEFLLHFPKRVKLLRKCPYCNKFFFAKDIKRKTRCYSRNAIKNTNAGKNRSPERRIQLHIIDTFVP